MNDLLDSAPCGFVSFADDGSIQTINATLLGMLGYPGGALDGRHIQSILSAGARIFYQTHFFPLLKMQGTVEEIYLSLRAKAGEEIPVLVNARRTERGGTPANDCVFVRMRQRANFEGELLKARDAAQKASKAKDDFLAALSHELRTPLNPVLLIASAMEMDPTLSERAREQAGSIRRNAELEARLIDDLLDLTRIAHGKMRLVPSSIDLHAVLSQTEEIVRSESSGKRVTVHFAKAATAHHVHGDSARLQQVFWNVLKNAIKFTPKGGEVHVTTSNDGTGRLTVRVTDTGIGIDSDGLSKIFNAFEQGNISTHSFGGLGLGLAITRAIVEMHGGSIIAQSPGRGGGATFTIEFDAVPAPAEGALSLPSPRAAAGRKLRLLLVEDHDSSREVLAAILRRFGHEVHTAGTGGEALRIAETAGSFHVVISDLGLPDTSGFDLMRTLQKRHGLPGVALSGYGMDDDVRKARAAGFSAHLIKPVSFDQLRVVLDQVAAGVVL